VKLDGDDLELQYRHTLENLGKQGGMLGTIFRKAQFILWVSMIHPWVSMIHPADLLSRCNERRLVTSIHLQIRKPLAEQYPAYSYLFVITP